MSWSINPSDAYLRLATETTDKELRAKALVAYDLINLRSPVLNGTYRASHIVSITPDYSYDPDKTTPDDPDIINLPDTRIIYIQTNSPYAEVIENGTDNREPVLVYKTAFDEISK